MMGLVDRLWRVFAAPRLTVILLVWLAVVLVLSAVIPQIPPRIEDPTVRSQWLANIPMQTRLAVERLQPLGLFNLLDSIWLRLPLALLSAHALVMLAAWAPAIRSRVGRPSPAPGSLGKSFRFEQDLPEPAERAWPSLRQGLENLGYRSLWMPDQASFMAWRWRWSWLGLAGIYLGLALVAAGLILQGWLGQAQDVTLEPDSPLPVAGVSNLTLQEVAVRGDDPLRPASGVAVLRMVSGAGAGRLLSLRLYGSRVWQGLWLTLAELRPVAEVRAVDVETSQPVLLQPFAPRVAAQERVRLPLLGEAETRFVGVPSRNLTLQVDYGVESGGSGAIPGVPGQAAQPDDVFSLSVFRGAEPAPAHRASLRSGDEATFADVRYRVVFDYDAGLRLTTAFWWVAVAMGWGLAGAGFITLMVAPPVYARGDLLANAKGSHLTLRVDVLGDAQRPQGEMQALATLDQPSGMSGL